MPRRFEESAAPPAESPDPPAVAQPAVEEATIPAAKDAPAPEPAPLPLAARVSPGRTLHTGRGLVREHVLVEARDVGGPEQLAELVTSGAVYL